MMEFQKHSNVKIIVQYNVIQQIKEVSSRLIHTWSGFHHPILFAKSFRSAEQASTLVRIVNWFEIFLIPAKQLINYVLVIGAMALMNMYRTLQIPYLFVFRPNFESFKKPKNQYIVDIVHERGFRLNIPRHFYCP